MKSKLLVLAALFAIASSCANDKNGKKDYLVTIHTEFGDMKAILYDETPLHKANFIELAENGLYDSTTWHRIIKEFMVQGGGIDMKYRNYDSTWFEKLLANAGLSEKPEPIDAEIDKGYIHHKGALAAARMPDQVNPERKSSWCQFYIVQGKVFTEDELTLDQQKLNGSISKLLADERFEDLKNQFVELQMKRDFAAMNQLAMDNKDLVEQELGVDLSKDFDPDRLAVYTTTGGAPHLDDAYTIFGKVIDGLDVVDKLAGVETARGDKPLEPTYLTIEVELISKKKITKMYGYEYE